MSGFIRTIEDDDEIDVNESESEDEEKSLFEDGFEFTVGSADVADEEGNGWCVDEDVLKMVSKRQKPQFSNLDAKIARAREVRRLKAEQKKLEGSKEEDDGSLSDEESTTSSDEAEMNDGEPENLMEECREDFVKVKVSHKIADSYFEDAPVQTSAVSFMDMNISRPILKAVSSLGYVTPSPIQARAVPVALMGKDICACAATGTGKTAAFFLPILERLLFGQSRNRVIRILILTPTRELAIQVFSVGRALAKYLDVEFCLAAGGLDSKSQEASLRKNPDIVVATPGRLVDHLHNAPSFSLATVEILVLDEADRAALCSLLPFALSPMKAVADPRPKPSAVRMLDEHFEDQMNEIIKLCPVKRQTMLFSATMTDQVEELVRLSLNHPVRLFVDANTDVARNLRQEFVRIRSMKEGDREAVLTALCCRSFKEHCLIFLPTKKAAHKIRIIFGILNLKAVELHGDLSQLQRIESLRAFTEGAVDFMLATDLASRGLDIARVKTVINMSMPSSMKQYIHRVGRTARAGRSGRSISLVGEKERWLLKEIMKQTRCPVKSRIVPPEVVVKYRDKLRSLADQVRSILKQEEEEKQMRLSEMELSKAQNLVEHREEILSRPARTWIKPGTKRKAESGLEVSLPLSKRAKKVEIKKRMYKKPVTEEEKAAQKERLEQEYLVRASKRGRRKKKTKEVERPRKKSAKKGHVKSTSVIPNFEKEITSTSRGATNQVERTQKSFSTKNKLGKFKSKKKYKRR